MEYRLLDPSGMGATIRQMNFPGTSPISNGLYAVFINDTCFPEIQIFSELNHTVGLSLISLSRENVCQPVILFVSLYLQPLHWRGEGWHLLSTYWVSGLLLRGSFPGKFTSLI